MTLGKNLSDLPYTGGSYIDDDCRFFFPSHVPDQNIYRRKSIQYHFHNPTLSNPLEEQDCKTKSIDISWKPIHPIPLTSHLLYHSRHASNTPPAPAHTSESLSRPDLIRVKIRTLVDLRNAEIVQVPIGQIETET